MVKINGKSKRIMSNNFFKNNKQFFTIQNALTVMSLKDVLDVLSVILSCARLLIRHQGEPQIYR